MSPPFSHTKNSLEALSDLVKKASLLIQRKSSRFRTQSQDPDIDSVRMESSADTNDLSPSLRPAAAAGESENLYYEAESPDEAALVYAARAYGFVLLARTPNNVTVKLPSGQVLDFEVLDTLTFDSNRKRMSVLVRHPVTKECVLYTKGADYAIMELLGTPYAGNCWLR